MSGLKLSDDGHNANIAAPWSKLAKSSAAAVKVVWSVVSKTPKFVAGGAALSVQRFAANNASDRFAAKSFTSKWRPAQSVVAAQMLHRGSKGSDVWCTGVSIASTLSCISCRSAIYTLDRYT
ncbi:MULTISPECIES: hypothetical protein [Bradyrhizobium]|uniref:Uncharacterized protein n=3 Tax=Bradyrhizobium TaxID=374 RepID=A0AAE5X8K9_9BRAD|nr:MULTISPECIES: hypothetical protein [Bradyrhizobium]MCG2631946.1 hypothetical protein [Bradyrhizobium zhengyangense]MCG2645001.1 hypothetical protein [Bradyrhizobium zhengyangense]MCG2672739.1 hypothetical protein [Bradyrhizobium zhengyangense]MDN4985410.1 hypothetical protein [Bradyrhizobium sp. WYCCWR 13022]MDN5002359.1 hypothetical protein [Bradyrhizobium sp. WYCCWR 12677]